MTTITRELIQTLRTDINIALAAIAAKHKVVLQAGNASFTAESATMKLTIAAVTAGSEGKSAQLIKAEADWKSQAILFGIKPELLGTTISYAGNKYVVLGLMPRRTKYPVLVSREGKNVLLPADALK